MGIIDFLKVKKGAPASQIGELEASLVRLRAEMAQATAIVEGHGQKRADMLLSDATDADIARLDADVALAQIRLERLEMAELELQERIDAASDSVDRSKRAAQLERAADEISEKTKTLDSAIAALAAAFDDLVKAIPVESGVEKDCDTITKPATPEDIARAILASGLYVAAPSAFEMVQPRNRSPRPACVERLLNVSVANQDGVLTRYIPRLRGEEAIVPPTPEAAQEIIVSRLRAQAAALRASADVARAAE